MLKRLNIAVIVVCAATLAVGLVDARWTHRWGHQAELVAAGERLAKAPEQIGDWQMRSSEPYDAETVAMLQCTGHFSRVYVNRVTGDVVSVALQVGPPGPTAVHTPEICYSSRGHSISELPTARATDRAAAPDETIWRMTFRTNDAEQRRLRVCYAWRGPHESHWTAAEDPRFVYATEPMLYKIQLASQLSDWHESNDQDPCQKFLTDFLPALDALFVPHGP